MFVLTRKDVSVTMHSISKMTEFVIIYKSVFAMILNQIVPNTELILVQFTKNCTDIFDAKTLLV